MVDDYVETYRPGSPVEQNLVEEMVAARWRMQRLRVIETSLLDMEVDKEIVGLPNTANGAEDAPPDPGRLLSRAISLASRYESRLHRIHERSHRTLRELQQTRIDRASAPAQPEPPAAPRRKK